MAPPYFNPWMLVFTTNPIYLLYPLSFLWLQTQKGWRAMVARWYIYRWETRLEFADRWMNIHDSRIQCCIMGNGISRKSNTDTEEEEEEKTTPHTKNMQEKKMYTTTLWECLHTRLTHQHRTSYFEHFLLTKSSTISFIADTRRMNVSGNNVVKCPVGETPGICCEWDGWGPKWRSRKMDRWKDGDRQRQGRIVI